jgi:hypothetical protein
MKKKKTKFRGLCKVKSCLGHYRMRISDLYKIQCFGFRISSLSKFGLAPVVLLALIFVSTLAGAAGAQSLTVTVSDQNGAPLENVKTYLYTGAGAYAGRNATTDDAGSADLGAVETLAAGSYSLRADFLGQQFWSSVFDLPAGADQHLTIEMAETIVTVGYAGQPAEGVKVYLFSAAGAYLSINQLTGADGKVQFNLPVGRDFKVRADILGSHYYSQVFQPQSGGSTVEVQAGGGRLQVTLQKQAGSPMAGIKLYLFNTAGAYLGRQLTSDSAGQAGFDVPVGDYRIRADYLGYQFWSQDVNVVADNALDFTIAHQDITFTLSGQYDALVPLEGVHLYLFTAAGSYVSINQNTGADGSIHLQLPDQPYKIRADYLNGQYWSDPFQFADAGLTIPLAQVDLTVVWNGMPLENVPVYLFTGAGSYTGIKYFTDAAGRISYRLPQTQWKFRADYQTNQYWAATDNPVPGQISPLTLSTGGGTLNFGVTLYQDETQALAGITCYVFNGQGTYTGVNGTTDAQGQATFDLAAGSYQIRVDYLGYQFWSELYSLTADTSDVFHIPHQPVTLTVNGQFDTPAPLADVKVYLFNAAGTYLGLQQTTDANGQVVFNLPEKAYKARIDYLGQQYWSAEFDSPSPVVDIPLARPDVTVYAAGQELAGTTVYVYGQDETYLGLNEVTDGQGMVFFELPAGQYKFKTTCLGHTFWSDPVQLTGGATPYVGINAGGGSFTLTVLKAATAPLANIKCYLYTSDGSQYLGQWASTDEYGQVSFDLVDGSFSFRLDHLGYQFSTPAYQVPETLAATLTIAHQDLDISVNGVLDGAAPLPDVKVYLFSAAGAYLGQQQITGPNGIVTFSLPARDFKVRADYMGYQFWSLVFNGQPVSVQIPLSRAAVSISGIGQPLENVPVFAFTGAGAYLGLNFSTAADGVSRFTLPAQQPYKFRADYQGGKFWSQPGSLDAGQETPVAIDTGGGLFDLGVQKDPYSPLVDLKCYVYTGQQAYIGTFGTSDADGRLTFALADGSYQFKIVYAGYNFWSPVIGVPAVLHHSLTISHSQKTIHVQAINPGPEPIAGAKAYVYTEAGAYIGLTSTTDTLGLVRFDLPGQAYKVKVVYNGQNYWTDILNGSGAVVSINQAAGSMPGTAAGLNASVISAGRIDLTWSAPADTTGLAGYAVYRRSVCDDSFVRLNAVLIEAGATAYSDTTVSGPGAWAYYVAAVNDQGLQGLPSDVATADPGGSGLGQNTSAVTNLAATWNQNQARLSWDNQAGLRYQVFRGLDPAALTPYQRVDAAPFDDPACDPATTYYYQVASVARQCDPASGQPVDLVGPLSALVTLGSRSSAVAATDLPINSQGQYLITTGSGSGFSLQGSYSGITGDATVSATLGDMTVTGTASGGTFSIDLPSAGNWQITITDGNDSTSLATVWAIDNQPPELTIDGPAQRTTTETQITITGHVQDDQSAVQSVAVASDRYPGDNFAASISSLGIFTGQVPLKTGDNQLTITATDTHNNANSKPISVTVQLTALPIVLITSPADGSSVASQPITVSGAVRSSLAPEKIRLVLADQVDFPEGATGDYTFSFNGVTLAPGSNTITVRAETPYGTVSAQTTVQYATASAGAEAALPQIEVFAPLPDTYLTGSPTVTGLVRSDLGVKAVTVNGQPAQTTGLGSAYASFHAGLSFAANQTEITITVAAIDLSDHVNSLSYHVYLDTTPPVITLDNTVQAPPAVTTTTQSPYAIAGTITEANLAGAFVNDQPIPLSPGAQAGTYAFSAGLPLTYGSDQQIVLTARDFAGNRTSAEWIVRLDSNLVIEVIAPRDGAQLQGQGDSTPVTVTVRVTGAQPDDTFNVALDGAAAQVMARSGSVGNLALAVPTARENHTLAVTVANSGGTVLSSTGTAFSLLNMDDVALALDHQTPGNNATGVEPNDFIALYFNKAIDPALLSIEVLETAHGKTYAPLAGGADITQLSRVKLVDVNRDREPVPGGVSHFPANRMAAFYPARDLAYGATVYVTAIYDGTEIVRSSYRVRPLPTFIEGMVTTTENDPLAAVEVSLPDLAMTVLTDRDGGFGFGYQLPAERNIPGGRYTALINPGMKNSAFGTIDQWVNVTEGRLNSMPTVLLPSLNPSNPFRRIRSGEAQSVLASGALVLDLSNAVLCFPDLRDQGDVHVQVLQINEVSHRVLPTAAPYWLFAVQPGGIGVSGTVGVQMAVPMREGSYYYVLGKGRYFVMVGLDPDSLTIMPVGVGKMDMETKILSSVAPLALQRLDYIGFAPLPAEAQAVIEQFANGQISLRQLTAELDNYR